MIPLRGSLAFRLFFLFFSLSLVPLGILAFLTYRTSQRVEHLSIQEGSSALIGEARGYLKDRTGEYAHRIDLQLARIENDARVVAKHAADILAHPDRYRVRWSEGRYERDESGIFWTPRDEGQGNLFISRGTPITPQLRSEISLTELFDPIMQEICDNDSNTSYIFFAGVDNLVRGYPWFDAVKAIEGGTLDPGLNLKEQPLFYLAGPEWAEEGRGVWSDVYLDVAGKGWMVTFVTPVLVGEEFRGVIGIDISLDRIRKRILDLRLSGGGDAFLLTGSGGVLAYSPEIAGDLGWEEGMSPDRFNLLASSNPSLAEVGRRMVAGSTGISRAEVSGWEVLISYAPIRAARWSLGLMVPVEAITRRALATSGKIEEQTGRLVDQELLISLLLLLAVAVATLITYHRIVGPLNELGTGATRIGEGDLDYRVDMEGRDEIGKLARTFNDMAESLQRRDRELEGIQSRLLESERLSSMGEVAAAVAHEIRNSLGTIKNSIYFLRSRLEDPDGSVQRHFSIMEEEVTAADRIVGELLDFSRGPELQLADVSINDLIREVLAVLGPEKGSDVAVEEDLAQDLPRITADPAQLRHALYNVVQNAFQVMNDGGTLRVRSGRSNGEIRVSIKDTGPGIEDEDIERLFEPFFTRKARGIGLGLPIAKRVIENHGGRIRIESRAGVGTTVSIVLPEVAPQEGGNSR